MTARAKPTSFAWHRRTEPFTAADFDRPFGLPPDKPKRSKYGAVKTVVDGITFDSKAEARRYGELKLLEKAKYIRSLMLQPVFEFTVRDKAVFKYVADFTYLEGTTAVIEDVKGMKTAVYRLKKKLIEAQFDIKITEVS
jgi:hypothetical protein